MWLLQRKILYHVIIKFDYLAHVFMECISILLSVLSLLAEALLMSFLNYVLTLINYYNTHQYNMAWTYFLSVVMDLYVALIGYAIAVSAKLFN